MDVRGKKVGCCYFGKRGFRFTKLLNLICLEVEFESEDSEEK